MPQLLGHFRCTRYYAAMHATVLLIHLLAAIFWIGGMATILFCVRPAARAVLEAPQPAVLLHATLARFLRYVGVAVILLLVTGIHLYGTRGGLGARWGVHVMAGGGIVMLLIYGHLRAGVFKKMSAAVARKEWPTVVAQLEMARKLVALNLAIGIAIIAAVKLGV